MHILRHPDEVQAFSQCPSSPSWMVDLIRQRLAELLADGDDMEDLVCFVIADGDTTLSDIESVLGHPVVNESGHPLWEVLETHSQGYEWVFVLHDSGYGAIVLVPDSANTDAEVLNLCRFQSRLHSTADAHDMRKKHHLM